LLIHQQVDRGVQIDDVSMIEHIHQLQQELIESASKKADLENTVRELKNRITELESSNKRLKECPPDGGVAAIQEAKKHKLNHNNPHYFRN
jgi:FtsZ-binding cell division protein ZapB